MKVRLLVAFTLVVICLAPAARAQWSSLLPFEYVESDAKKSYNLTQKNGPWLILATTFSGPDAKERAHELAVELRQRYKLKAYTHKKEIKLDEGDDLLGRGFDKFGRQKRMTYFNRQTTVEYAVLVEDYETIDAPGVAATLKTIKAARPETFKKRQAANHVAGSRMERSNLSALEAYRQAQLKDIAKIAPNRSNLGPMRHAFVTRNPMLPANYFAPQGMDKLVLSMNQGVKHSLLACPSKYTLRIATFRGNVTIDQNESPKSKRARP